MGFYSAGRKGWGIICFFKEDILPPGSMRLTLRPFGRKEIHVPLGFVQDGAMAYRASEEYGVFAGLTYEVVLEIQGMQSVVSVTCEINGCPVSCHWENGVLRFDGKWAHGRIFLDCYGYVQLFFAVTDIDGKTAEISTAYLPVFLPKGTDHQAVYAMLAYVGTQYEALLCNPGGRVRSPAGLQQGECRSTSMCILHLEHIANIYEANFSAFQANGRHGCREKETVGRFAQLQHVTGKVLRDIVQHPCQLQPATYPTGIRYGRQYFEPGQVLVSKQTLWNGIYENRMIFGFLQTAAFTAGQMRRDIAGLIKRFPKDGQIADDHIGPACYFYGGTKETLCDNLHVLDCLVVRFEKLYRLYQELWELAQPPVLALPKPTAVFLSIPHYQAVYRAMEQWFLYGAPDLSREELLLSFLEIESLYEYYVLAKLHHFLVKQQFKLYEKKRCSYPVPRGKYRNTWCCNTFYYRRAKTKVTLYYQPVVYCSDEREINQIGLHRNTTISLPNDAWKERHGRYYVPDYLFKIVHPEKTVYFILDAKFSTLSNVKAYVLESTVYKYLFSISPLDIADVLAGFCIVNGKTESNGAAYLLDVHDVQLPGEQSSPKALLLTMAETGEASEPLHQLLLEQVLGPFLNP